MDPAQAGRQDAFKNALWRGRRSTDPGSEFTSFGRRPRPCDRSAAPPGPRAIQGENSATRILDRDSSTGAPVHLATVKILERCVSACVVILAVLAAGGCVRVAGPVGEPKGFVAGVVQDPAGMPVPSIWIATDRDRAGVPLIARSDVEGRFRFEGLSEGKVVLRVMGASQDIRTGFLVETTAGTKDLEVTVEPGPQVLVRIAGYEAPREGDGRHARGHARLVWVEADGSRPVRYAPISKDGRARFVQLPQDRSFELWATAGGGRVVRTPGLKAGDVEVRVEATEAKRVSGKVLVRAKDEPRLEHAVVNAEAYPGFVVSKARPAADGTFSIGDLPEGTYTIAAAFNWGEVLDSRSVTVPAGARDLVLDLPSR